VCTRLCVQNGYAWYLFPESGVLRVDFSTTAEVESSFQDANGSSYIADYARKEKRKALRSLNRARALARRMKGRRVLDVGSNVGLFCAAAHSLGLLAQGIEIGATLCNHARQRFPHLQFHCTSLEAFETDERFDGIYCSEVIEHTLDPLMFARKLRTLLAPGGVLYLTTPAAGEYLESGIPWRNLSAPDHKIYFDRNNIGPFLRKAGFTAVKVLPNLKFTIRPRSIRFTGGLQVFAR